VSTDPTVRPRAESETHHAPAAGAPRGLVAPILIGLAVVVLSVITVLRYTVDFLQADGVQQSVMSVQSVQLFYWGQDRLAAFVPLLASPVADPKWNLFACLLINALSFHVVLLVLAWMGVRVLTGTRSALATGITFLVLSATAHTTLMPGTVHTMALEGQPYSLSWALALGAFMLWKRGQWWAWGIAAVMAWAALGLNPTSVLGAAFLAVIELVRRRQVWRWILFAVVWSLWFVVWQWLSARFGGRATPAPEPALPYFTFSVGEFATNASASVQSILESLRTARVVVLVGVASLALVALDADRRAALVRRFALATVFVVGFWTLFTGNAYVTLGGFHFRYFYPVLIFVVLCLAAPVAAVLAGWPATLALPERWAGRLRPQVSALRAMSTVVAVLAVAVAVAGPLRSPDTAPVLTETRATGRYAVDHGIRFISGYYWDMWPTLWAGLASGRNALFVTGLKSGGDPAGYRDAFREELAKGPGYPRAMCVNQPVSACTPFIDYWTAPGWEATGETCPIPPDIEALGSPPPERSCRVLEYRGARS
jgi:hypothetical protein